MSDLLPREDLNLNCSDQNRMSCQVRRRGTVEGKASLRDWRICSRRKLVRLPESRRAQSVTGAWKRGHWRGSARTTGR